MQKFAKIIFWLFILGGIALLFIDKNVFPNFYNPEYMAGVAFVSALAIYAPRIFFKNYKNLNGLQNTIALALALNGLGALGMYKLYSNGFGYDKIIHFFISMLSVLTVFNLFSNRPKSNFRSALKWSVFITLAGGIGWEIYETAGDMLFNTAMFGHYGEHAAKDTILDLIMNFCGAGAGVIILFRKKKKETK